MIICLICKKEFLSNVDGSLTKHLLKEHNISYEDYYINFYCNGLEPKCKCGLCNDRPVFYRGKFKKYAFGHNSNDYYIKKYVEKYGEPLCLYCNKPSGFSRKKPKIFCSPICSGLYNKENVIIKMKPKIINKWKNKEYRELKCKQSKEYSNREDVKINQKQRMKDKWKDNEFKEKMSQIAKDKWKNPEIRKKMIEAQKISLNTSIIKKLRSDIMKDKWKRGLYNNSIENIKWKFSKLHVKFVNELNLRELGFIGEQRIGKYLVDEFHPEYKIIIEINGNYVHANPKIYNSDDIIRLVGNSYTASEKWETDNRKINYLKDNGYKVLVIWENDNIREIKNKINNILSTLLIAHHEISKGTVF